MRLNLDINEGQMYSTLFLSNFQKRIPKLKIKDIVVNSRACQTQISAIAIFF
jgi:hypothetical protein